MSTWRNGVPVGVVEGDARVCDGDARRGRMRISLLLMMVVVGWPLSYYVIVLVRGYAESTSCRGMARLAFAQVETVRRLRMVKASTWASFLHTRYRYVLLTKNCAHLEVGVLQ